MVQLSKSATEYLLEIPYDQRQRAKGIEGRRWDPTRKCWVYPRTRRCYDALLAEFGDEDSFKSISRPSVQKPETPTTEEQNRLLQERVEQIQSTLRALTEESRKGANSDGLAALLAEKDKEIHLLRNASQHLRDSERLAKSEMQRMERKIQLLETQKAPAQKNLGELARTAAKMATGEDPDFVRTVDGLQLNPMFPLEIAKQIERHLRDRLEATDPQMSLFDLLQEVRDRELLPDEAIALAHTIRRQRNILAHYEVDPVTNPARTLLVLFAASVLWPYLTHWEAGAEAI